MSRTGFSPVLQGIFMGFAGYAIFSGGDALIKHSGATANVFVIGFFVTLFSAIPWLVFRRPDERWSTIFETRRTLLVNARGVTGVIASMMSIYAFTNLPIAEAYALIFLIPFSITVFSILFLKEQVNWQRWATLAIGFVGIMLVVRPGFREVTLAHAAGVGVAIFGGLSVVLTRELSRTESRQSLMAALLGYLIIAYFTMMMIAGFRMPSGGTMLALFAAGLCSGCGHLLIIGGLNRAPANRVGATQYTQILWAVILGAVFFNEFPDAFTYLGLGVVGLSGILAFLGTEPAASPRPKPAE